MRLLALLACLLLAGCATSRTSPFTPDSCDPSGAATINHDAPRLPIFDDALGLAQATARGLGERWLDDTPEHVWEDSTRWDTGDGSIVVTLAPEVGLHGGGISVELSTTRPGAFTEASLRNLGRELGVSEEGAFSTYGQTRQGWLSWGWPAHRHQGSIAAVGPSGTGTGYVTFHAIHSLAAARTEVAMETAVATAQAYARCDLDREGRTEAAGYRFHAVGEHPRPATFGDSFVIEVTIWFTEPASQESHCGLSRNVAVDAVTGAVVGEPIVYCD